MLWADGIGSVNEAKGNYYEQKRVFSARLSTINLADILDVEMGDDGEFSITITQAFIDLLENGTRYEDGEESDPGKYTWSLGNATTWLITPETDDELWEEYETWDGEKVDDTLFVFKLGSTE